MQRVDLIIGVEDKLKWWQNIIYAIQQLTVDTTILIIPVLLARTLQFPLATGAFMVQAVLIGAGLVTIGQALWILRLPVLQGPAIVFVSVVPAVVAVSGPAAAWTGMVIASLIAAVLSAVGFWGKTRNLFGSPQVYSVVLLMAALTISGTIFGQILGVPNTPTFGQPFNFVLAFIPFAISVLVVLLMPSSFLRLISLLLGAVVAILIALISGRMNLAGVANAPWIGLSVFFPFGFQFDLGATLVMLIAFIADLGQVVGSYLLMGEVIGKQKVSDKRIDGGILTESLGSALSSAFGGLPTVTYNQNIGAVSVTGIGSRFVFATAGVILVILGLVPKVGAIVSAIPGPIVGGLLLSTIAMLCMQAIRVMGAMSMTNANMFAVGTSIVVGIGVSFLPKEFIAMLPVLLRPFVASSVVIGFLSAIVLHVIFNLVLKAGELEQKKMAGKGQ
ncbi:uracil-xanthine permease family protein [Moorella sp. Hama-1]|uniref:uracil-xanthine permease family protein n=1 Tax=Moorella sp. Hama-1 TaxID=2138101 RepID=UPI002073A502|nr:solute carrier family 23 protein [Moorella sp. Hama-1]